MLRSIPWPGGKARRTKWISPRLPVGAAYAEPFGGMASVLLNRPPAAAEMLSDIDPDVIGWWLAVRDQPGELAETLAAMPQTRSAWTDARRVCRAGPGHGTERAARWCMWIADSWGGAGYTYAPAAAGRSGSAAMPGRIPALSARLAETLIVEADGVDVIAQIGADHETVIYVDPPYPTRDGDYAGRVDQAALDDVLISSQAMVAVSGYAGERPRLEAAGWRRHHRVEQMAMSTTGANRRTEALWTNYDIGLPGI